MDASRGYYAKSSKSGRERQILHGFTHRWNLKTKQTNKTKTDSQLQKTK